MFFKKSCFSLSVLSLLFVILFTFSVNCYSFNWRVNSVELTKREELILESFKLNGYFVKQIQINNLQKNQFSYFAWIDHYVDGEHVNKIPKISGTKAYDDIDSQFMYMFFSGKDNWRVKAFEGLSWGAREEAQKFNSFERKTWITYDEDLEYEDGETAILAIGLADNEHIEINKINNWDELSDNNLKKKFNNNENVYIYKLKLLSN
jgi:hypothetical protein